MIRACDGLRRHLVWCRLLVALIPSPDLFICAKDLFVGAKRGVLMLTLRPADCSAGPGSPSRAINHQWSLK